MEEEDLAAEAAGVPEAVEPEVTAPEAPVRPARAAMAPRPAPTPEPERAAPAPTAREERPPAEAQFGRRNTRNPTQQNPFAAPIVL